MMKMENKYSILVVDDERLIVDLLNDYFTELGFDVRTAFSAEEALDILKNGHNFSLILTDINLPGKSGLDLLKIIKETRSNLPVVLLTGMKTLDNAISAVKIGADDYITKPFELKLVQRIVERILRKQYRVKTRELVYDNLHYLKLGFEFDTDALDAGILAHELTQYLEKMEFADEEETGRFEMVFTETLVNAIEHGNLELSSSKKNTESFKPAEFEELRLQRISDPRYGKRKIYISMEIDKNLFNLMVRDEGGGFNWHEYLDHLHRIKPVDTLPYGRGFRMIQHVIDEVHFSEKGNVITLIKNRSSQT
jgi:DNA-binding response OmpR family regulator